MSDLIVCIKLTAMYSFYVGNVRELGIMGINDDLYHISFYSLLP